jgi:hypothetical protein
MKGHSTYQSVFVGCRVRWCPEPDSNRHGPFRVLGILSPSILSPTNSLPHSKALYHGTFAAGVVPCVFSTLSGSVTNRAQFFRRARWVLILSHAGTASLPGPQSFFRPVNHGNKSAGRVIRAAFCRQNSGKWCDTGNGLDRQRAAGIIRGA